MKKERTWSSMNLRQNGMIIALIVIILGFGIATGGTLFRPMNISNIFMQNSYEIILAIGMFFCLTTGGNVDLSVGSVVAFAGAMMGALTLNSGMPTWQADPPDSKRLFSVAPAQVSPARRQCAARALNLPQRLHRKQALRRAWNKSPPAR